MLSADVGVDGPIDGTGRRHPEGSYVRLHVRPQGVEDGRHFKISRGAAEVLVAELQGVLNDRHTC